MLVELFLVLFVISLILYHHFTKNNNYWKERNVAGPEPTFLFGNIKDDVLRKRSTMHIYKEIYDRYPDEKIVGIFRMTSPDLLVKDLEIIKHIMVKDSEYFMDRDVDFVEEGLGANLFHANGDTWRALRHRFTPIFTSGKLKNMMYLITERADKLVDYVDKITKVQPEQEVLAITKKFTQSCIAACAFGLDEDTFVNPNNMIDNLEFKIFTPTHRSKLEMIYPGILKRLGVSPFTPEVATFFSELTKAVVAQRKGEPSNRNDFMDLMLRLRKVKKIPVPRKDNVEVKKTVDMTDDVMAGQMFIFYIAAYQSSATTMAFMLYYLALYPDIQDKVLEEIGQVLEKYEGKLSYQAVLELKYMGQVFDETLRQNPSGDTLRRRALSDYKIPGTNLTVNKGQIFIVSIPVIHMDPNNYENPEVFDPDRFSPENVAARHCCAYLPFGVGPRHCIGGVWSLKNLSISVPRAVLSGEGQAAVLRCSYDLEGAALYSIRWYRAETEFYRYVPRELPPSMVFPLPGASVDLTQSDENQVRIVNLNRRLSGDYQCEVSADAPLFHTDIRSAPLTVVDPPFRAPRLTVSRGNYARGDVIRAHCTVDEAYPAPNITWILDEHKIAETIPEPVSELDFTERGASSQLEITVLETEQYRVGLTYTSASLARAYRDYGEEKKNRTAVRYAMVPPPSGQFELGCVSTILDIYARKSEPVTIREDAPHPASVTGEDSSSTVASCSLFLVACACAYHLL